MEARVIFWFISIPLLVYFVESIRAEKISRIFLFISLYSSFLIGNCIYSPWVIDFSEKYHWILHFNPFMTIFINIFLGLSLVIIIPRDFRSYDNQNSRKKKIYNGFIFLGIIIAFLGEGFVKSLDIIYLREIFMIFGFSMSTIAYLHYPKAIFLHSVKIFHFSIIDIESGMDLFRIEDNSPLYEYSFYASTIIQQKIAQAKSKIKMLDFGDKKFVLVYQKYKNRNLGAILLVNRTFFSIEKTIRFILTQFIQNYSHLLSEKLDDLAEYSTFSTKLEVLFNLLPFELTNMKEKEKEK